MGQMGARSLKSKSITLAGDTHMCIRYIGHNQVCLPSSRVNGGGRTLSENKLTKTRSSGEGKFTTINVPKSLRRQRAGTCLLNDGRKDKGWMNKDLVPY